MPATRSEPRRAEVPVTAGRGTRFLIVLLLFPLAGWTAELRLEGLPRQLAWADVDGDGNRDLVALMMKVQTEGQVTTYYEDGTLHGVYEDETVTEKVLVTRLYRRHGWVEVAPIELGRDAVLGFEVVEDETNGGLLLWRERALVRYNLRDDGWAPVQRIETPGFLARGGVSMESFPFWQIRDDRAYWLVPDLDGLHMVPGHRPSATVFVPYPDLAIESDEDDQGAHTLTLDVPALIPLDRDPIPELVFQGSDRAMGWRIGEPEPAFSGLAEGILIDLDGDGMADLIRAEEEGEVERLRDLKKMRTRIQTHIARAPLDFPDRPSHEQVVPGIVLTENETDIELAEPFLDINGDGRADLVGIALKLTVFKLIKAAATGRLRVKFLMHLTVQKPDGTFETLAGGPFEMVWQLNIRRLELPALAQLTADFDGDGWVDILMEKGKRYEITKVTAAGIGAAPAWKGKLPRSVRDPDQIYGRDLDGDGRAELIAIVLTGRETRIAVLEVVR